MRIKMRRDHERKRETSGTELYKRGSEYNVSDEIGRQIIKAGAAKAMEPPPLAPAPPPKEIEPYDSDEEPIEEDF